MKVVMMNQVERWLRLIQWWKETPKTSDPYGAWTNLFWTQSIPSEVVNVTNWLLILVLWKTCCVGWKLWNEKTMALRYPVLVWSCVRYPIQDDNYWQIIKSTISDFSNRKFLMARLRCRIPLRTYLHLEGGNTTDQPFSVQLFPFATL